MHYWRFVGIACVVTTLAVVPLFTAWMPLSPWSPSSLKSYPANQAFLHETGISHPDGWEAYYREHRPGYLVRGLQNGGEKLPPGTYRFDFYFSLRIGHLASLLSHANDVVRLEAADASTQEILRSRTFQLADFPRGYDRWVKKSISFSTLNRGGHRFEPKVYWQGLSGIFLQRVELVSLGDVPMQVLQQKAVDFEAMMPNVFLDHGYIVTRDNEGRAVETGDAAIWTGLYVAAEAYRFKATQDPEAQKRLEQSLWALHNLCKSSPLPGSLVRYVDPQGRALEEPASKDTYTGFFYGVAQAMPYVKDAALKKALREDIEKLAGHFLDHDLSFVSPYGNAVDMNPYPDQEFGLEAARELRLKASLRHDLIKTFQVARWYFWTHGQRPPAAFGHFVNILKNPASADFDNEFIPLLNATRTGIKQLQKNVHRSALRGPREGLRDTPYIKLDLLLLRALRNLDEDSSGKPFESLDQFKVLPSQALHALHFIKVAGDLLPQPNRFQRYYEANLYQGKSLLRTAIQWHQIDEEALTAVVGQTEADTRRTASSHLSYLALYDLIQLEKDPLVRFQYQKLFEDQYLPMSSDDNAMIDAMHAAVGLSAKQLGLAWWSLGRYPVDRIGKGDLYWQEHRRELLDAFGGEVSGQAREVLPPDLRPRDAFLWQRSAHSIRGDQAGWIYSPLDYLFAYWLARTTAKIPSRTDEKIGQASGTL